MITIDSVVTDYIDQSEQSIHKYNKLWNIAFRGMEQLGLDFFYSVKTIKMPISATKTVQLPSGYLKYTKIGVLNSVGEIIPLKFNPELTNFASLMPDREQKTEDNELNFFNIYNPASPIFFNYYYDGLWTNLYGIPSGGYGLGQFNIDTDNGVILLDSDFQFDYLMIEYIAAPVEGNEYYIPVQFREALIAFLAWQDIAFLPSTRRGSISDKAERKTNFYNERRLANARFKPYYKEQAYDLALEMTRMAVKS